MNQIDAHTASGTKFAYERDGDVQEVVIPPVSLDSARRALKLHPADGHAEGHAEFIFRLLDEAKILLGASFEHLTAVLTPCEVRELLAAVWWTTLRVEPAEAAVFPLRQTPARTTQPAAQLLATVEMLAVIVPEEFPSLAGRVGDLPVSALMTMVHQIHLQRRSRN